MDSAGILLGGTSGAMVVKSIDSPGGKAQERTDSTLSPNVHVNNPGNPGSGAENKNKVYEKDLFYKEYLGITIPLTIIVAIFVYIVIRLIIILIYAAVEKGARATTVKPLFVPCEDVGSRNAYYYLSKVGDGLIVTFTLTTLKTE